DYTLAPALVNCPLHLVSREGNAEVFSPFLIVPGTINHTLFLVYTPGMFQWDRHLGAHGIPLNVGVRLVSQRQLQRVCVALLNRAELDPSRQRRGRVVLPVLQDELDRRFVPPPFTALPIL